MTGHEAYQMKELTRKACHDVINKISTYPQHITDRAYEEINVKHGLGLYTMLTQEKRLACLDEVLERAEWYAANGVDHAYPSGESIHDKAKQ